MIEYKERRRIVDEMKDELQNKITEYSKLVESGVFSLYNIVYVCMYVTLYSNVPYLRNSKDKTGIDIGLTRRFLNSHNRGGYLNKIMLILYTSCRQKQRRRKQE